MSTRLVFWRGLSCVTVLLACAGPAASDLAADGSVAVSITTPVNQYISVPKELPAGLPTPGAQATVIATLTDPSLQEEETIAETVVVWFVDSVKVADGTKLNGSPWAPCDLPQELYNSNTSDVENRVLKTPGSLSTDVRLGLKETGHVQVTVSAGVRWDITRPGGSRSEYASSGPLVIDFYGVQAKLLAVPRVIAAKASGYLPICFRILGPGQATPTAMPATGARINSVTVHFTPAPGSATKNYTARPRPGHADPEGLLPGDQVCVEPLPSDPMANIKNGQSNTYTVLVNPLTYSTVSVAWTGSHRSEDTELWLDAAVTITKPDPSQGGTYVDVVSGPPLATGKVRKHENGEETVLGVVCLDLAVPVMELGLSNSANPTSAFQGLQTTGSKPPTVELRKYDGSAWQPTGIQVPDNNAFGVFQYIREYTRDYRITNRLNTSGWDDSSAGDRWRLAVGNREQGAFAVVYYGKRSCRDVNGTHFVNDGTTRRAGVVDVRKAKQQMDAVLFGGSRFVLSIVVDSGGSVGPSQTLDNISSATNLAAGVCAILSLPTTGGGSLIPWAAEATAGFWTASGLTNILAQAVGPDGDVESSARAECFGGMTIQDPGGNNDDEDGYVAPVASNRNLQTPDHPANTLRLAAQPGQAAYLRVGGDVHIRHEASVHHTWRLFSSATATTFVTEESLQHHAASAYVTWRAPVLPRERGVRASEALVYRGLEPNVAIQPDPTVGEE